MAGVPFVDALCDECYARFGHNDSQVFLQMPTARDQPELRWGMSYLRNKRICKVDECPLCRRQAGRFKPLPIEQDPSYIIKVRDPNSTCRDPLPSTTFMDCSNFNKSVMMFVWLMVAFWVSMMVITSFDNKAYWSVGRSGVSSGFSSYFASLGSTMGVYRSNSQSDTFSIVCVVFCIINVVMVLGRVLMCSGTKNQTTPPPRLQFQSDPPQSLQTFRQPLTYDEQSQADNFPVKRSNQFLAEPLESDFETESDASFLKYGPQTLNMENIAKQKGSRLSQSGDEFKKLNKKRLTAPKSTGILARKITPTSLKLGKNDSGTVRESTPPILGRGRPETARDLDLIGKKVNRANQFYSPVEKNAYLLKPRRASVGSSLATDPNFLGMLRTDEARRCVKNVSDGGDWKSSLNQAQRDWLNRNQPY